MINFKKKSTFKSKVALLSTLFIVSLSADITCMIERHHTTMLGYVLEAMVFFVMPMAGGMLTKLFIDRYEERNSPGGRLRHPLTIDFFNSEWMSNFERLLTENLSFQELERWASNQTTKEPTE